MRVLGAVLAGGAASRFGSDKALALWEGRTLLDHVLARLAPQVDAVAVCGRAVPGAASLADRPVAGLGPLGALNAALHWGAAEGYDAVLSVPCDTPLLPEDLRARLGEAPAYLARAPVIGLWPCAAASWLDALLAAGGSRAVRAFAAAIGARAVGCEPPRNVNTVAELAALGQR